MKPEYSILWFLPLILGWLTGLGIARKDLLILVPAALGMIIYYASRFGL